MTPRMYFAAFAWIILVIGYSQRRIRARHVPLMLTGILMDIGLVAYLEFTKHALETALEFKLGILQQLHIALSSIALILYLPILWLGFALIRGHAVNKRLHVRLGHMAIIFRTLGFILMFSMWKS